MGLRFNRCLGPATALQHAEWTDETATGRPALRCVCGHIFELPETHHVIDGGWISPVLACPSEPCPFMEFVQLEAWKLEETAVLR